MLTHHEWLSQDRVDFNKPRSPHRLRALDIAVRLGGAVLHPDLGLICNCPAHPATGPCLLLRDHGDGLLLNCLAGCDPMIVGAELRFRDLQPPRDPEYRPTPRMWLTRPRWTTP